MNLNFGDLNLASITNAIFSISCWVNLEDTLKPCAILSKRSPYGGFEYSIDNHFRNKQFFNFPSAVKRNLLQSEQKGSLMVVITAKVPL